MNGNGSDLTNDKAIKGRAKRKMITNKMILSLADIAKENRDREMLQGYWNTYYCQSKIYTANGKLYGKYCKNRTCLLCCSIRKADIMNRYLPFMRLWENPYLLTITAKSVSLERLPKRMVSMINGMKIIISKYRKRNQRNTGIKLKGIRSLECNFNPLRQEYNPHLHIIVETKEMAEIIRNEWLRMCPRRLANPAAQKISKIYNNETALIEVVKYGSKIFTEPDVNNKASKNPDRDIYAAALHNIFRSMKGLRIFERFGFNLPKSEKSSNSKIVKEYHQWMFEPSVFDWINPNCDRSLSGYIPSIELVNLLTYRINTKTE